MAEIAVTVEEAEREYTWLCKRARAPPEQAVRVRDKLRAEWAALQDQYTQRHDRYRTTTYTLLHNKSSHLQTTETIVLSE